MSEIYPKDIPITLVTDVSKVEMAKDILNVPMSTDSEPEPIVNDIVMVLTFQRD